MKARHPPYRYICVFPRNQTTALVQKYVFPWGALRPLSLAAAPTQGPSLLAASTFLSPLFTPLLGLGLPQHPNFFTRLQFPELRTDLIFLFCAVFHGFLGATKRGGGVSRRGVVLAEKGGFNMKMKKKGGGGLGFLAFSSPPALSWDWISGVLGVALDWRRLE